MVCKTGSSSKKMPPKGKMPMDKSGAKGKATDKKAPPWLQKKKK